MALKFGEVAGAIFAFIPGVSTITSAVKAWVYYRRTKRDQQEMTRAQEVAEKIGTIAKNVILQRKEDIRAVDDHLWKLSLFEMIPIVQWIPAVLSLFSLSSLSATRKTDEQYLAEKYELSEEEVKNPRVRELLTVFSNEEKMGRSYLLEWHPYGHTPFAKQCINKFISEEKESKKTTYQFLKENILEYADLYERMIEELHLNTTGQKRPQYDFEQGKPKAGQSGNLFAEFLNKLTREDLVSDIASPMKGYALRKLSKMKEELLTSLDKLKAEYKRLLPEVNVDEKLKPIIDEIKNFLPNLEANYKESKEKISGIQADINAKMRWLKRTGGIYSVKWSMETEKTTVRMKYPLKEALGKQLEEAKRQLGIARWQFGILIQNEKFSNLDSDFQRLKKMEDEIYNSLSDLSKTEGGLPSLETLEKLLTTAKAEIEKNKSFLSNEEYQSYLHDACVHKILGLLNFYRSLHHPSKSAFHECILTINKYREAGLVFQQNDIQVFSKAFEEAKSKLKQDLSRELRSQWVRYRQDIEESMWNHLEDSWADLEHALESLQDENKSHQILK